MLNRTRLTQAFDLLGADLARRGVFVELAVYGGSAIILQFDWRRSTEDVDAVVRQGSDESVLRPSVEAVAETMGLPPNWLNNAVGMFTPLREPDTLFELSGIYPKNDNPGLRVLLATPRYLLAMKLRALDSLDRGDRDMIDARSLATELGITGVDDLRALYVSIHGEEPGDARLRQFTSVVASR